MFGDLDLQCVAVTRSTTLYLRGPDRRPQNIFQRRWQRTRETIFTLTRETVESGDDRKPFRCARRRAVLKRRRRQRPTARPVGRNHADRRGTDRGDRTKWARQRPIGVFQLRRSVAR